MNIDKIKKKYEKALELKKGNKYAATLKSELSKPEWKDTLQEISERIDSIGSKNDFEKYTKQLESLFENIYEKITAPGLDAFIEWINLHAKNQENVQKLRTFLKSNYETYSTSIDKILSAIDSLPKEDEKHLFDNLLEDFNRKLKSEVSSIVNEPAKFENTIDGLLDKLSSEYIGMSAIADLTYTNIDQLYTEEQKNTNALDFYEGIIKQAIAKGQNLSPLDDSEKDQFFHERASRRIRSIKACISTLIGTGMSGCTDEQLKALFLRYDKEMLVAKGDVPQSTSQTLSNYLKKIWEPLQEKYYNIKDFHEEEELTFTESDWEDFEKKDDISALYKDYMVVRNGNILSQIPMMNLEDVGAKITSCSKKITDLREKENSTGKAIREYFEEFVYTYNKQKQMLDKLIEKHPNLRGLYDEIYSPGKSITTLTNGINSIKNDGTFLKELSDGTISDMIDDMKKIKETFLDILEQSQMENQINWLNGLSSDVIGESEFNQKYLLPLIKEGLITLKFKKEF